ncbi:hypothetical protein [Streptomyces sp. NPDC088789]|uniref:hypothetical protein n=1 Tax=Streptomyces sp. NPDC088789 TaxID=3365899 RepID=UPI003819E576
MTSKKVPIRRWAQGLNGVMPKLLDTTGIILLSGSAMLAFGVAAGTAALGAGCLVLNWRFYSGT